MLIAGAPAAKGIDGHGDPGADATGPDGRNGAFLDDRISGRAGTGVLLGRQGHDELLDGVGNDSFSHAADGCGAADVAFGGKGNGRVMVICGAALDGGDRGPDAAVASADPGDAAANRQEIVDWQEGDRRSGQTPRVVTAIGAAPSWLRRQCRDGWASELTPAPS